jgi:hypothetical protein
MKIKTKGGSIGQGPSQRIPLASIRATGRLCSVRFFCLVHCLVGLVKQGLPTVTSIITAHADAHSYEKAIYPQKPPSLWKEQKIHNLLKLKR